MRRTSGLPEGVGMSGAAPPDAPPAPEVRIEVCTCGCVAREDGTAAHPDWPLAQAWAWLTRPVEQAEDVSVGDLDDVEAEAGEDDAVGAADPASLPWWDARSGAAKRRAVLPLVLLGELQAGVLLRAVWEVAQSGSGPTA